MSQGWVGEQNSGISNGSPCGLYLVKYLEGLVQRGHVIRLNITLDLALRKERREVKLSLTEWL